MGYNTDLAEWPSHPIPQAVKSLIDRFFNLLDNPSPGVGNTLADEVFTTDAKAQFGIHTFEEQDQIRKSREGAWTLFNSRKHQVLRVYSHDEASCDLLFIGYVAMDLKNGQHVAGEFTGRFVIANPQSSAPKLKSYSIWADSGPLVKALESK